MQLDAYKKSVVQEPLGSTVPLVLMYHDYSSRIPRWGNDPLTRDQALREFWPQEPVFASALGNNAMRYAAFGWQLKGPVATVRRMQDMFNFCEHGDGWQAFVVKHYQDLCTQDNGAFIELVRAEDSPYSPVLTFNTLDAGRCRRTGHRDAPVLYSDMRGNHHLLKWYQVIASSEFPSPQERFLGMQICALSRCLIAAEILRDIAVYKQEKIGGRFHRSIHLVSGVATRLIDEAIAQHHMAADDRGLLRYLNPVVLSTTDPNAHVTHAQIDLAALPDNFDADLEMRWYINQLALAFGVDYQDFAPLPGGNLGSSQQSEIMHLKSRGKGPAYFMRMLEQKFNYWGVMPRSVTFEFGDLDIEEDMMQSELRKRRAEWVAILIASNTITPAIGRQILVDAGDLREEYLMAMGEENVTPDVIGSSSIPVHKIDPDNIVVTGPPMETPPEVIDPSSRTQAGNVNPGGGAHGRVS